MIKIISGLAMIGVFATSASADEKYPSFEVLTADLMKLASGKNIASATCGTNRYDGYKNEGSNYFRGAGVEVIASNYDDVTSRYFNKHVKAKPSQQDVGKKCYDIVEGAKTTITFSSDKENTSSNTISTVRDSQASFDAKVDFGMASIDTNYSTAVSNTSTSTSTSGSSDGSSTTSTFSWTKDLGDYRVWMQKNHYSLIKTVTLPVDYHISNLEWKTSCHYKKSETFGHDIIRNPAYSGKTSMSDLGKTKNNGPLKVTIPTEVKFNVSFYDKWPSYTIQHGKSCEQK
ncbi:hypothetical protein N9F03_06175 [Planktomarina temperata]|nr:hypothetical protein [Planktomarina temperata]